MDDWRIQRIAIFRSHEWKEGTSVFDIYPLPFDYEIIEEERISFDGKSVFDMSKEEMQRFYDSSIITFN